MYNTDVSSTKDMYRQRSTDAFYGVWPSNQFDRAILISGCKRNFFLCALGDMGELLSITIVLIFTETNKFELGEIR